MTVQRVYVDDISTGDAFWLEDPAVFIVFVIAGVSFLIPLFITFATTFVFMGIGYVRFKPIAGVLGTLSVFSASSVAVGAWVSVLFPFVAYDATPRPWFAVLVVLLCMFALVLWPLMGYLILKKRWILFRGKGAKHTYLTLWSLGMTVWTLINGVVLMGVMLFVGYFLLMMDPIKTVETDRGTTLTFYNLRNTGEAVLVEKRGWNVLAMKSRWVYGYYEDEGNEGRVEWLEENQCFRVNSSWSGRIYVSMPGLAKDLTTESQDLLSEQDHEIVGLKISSKALGALPYAPITDGQGTMILRMRASSGNYRNAVVIIHRPGVEDFQVTGYSQGYYFAEVSVNGERLYVDLDDYENDIIFYAPGGNITVIDQATSIEWAMMANTIENAGEGASTQPASIMARLKEVYPDFDFGVE